MVSPMEWAFRLIVRWYLPRWNRLGTMYMTLIFLWWLFFVNREATLWSVSSMRSSRMLKCFSLGSRKQETPDILRLRSHIFPGEEQKAYADIFLRETDFFVSALNPALFLASFSFLETKKSHLSRWGTESVRRYLVIYPSLSKINSVLREMRKQ
jgi:hypothetical protein